VALAGSVLRRVNDAASVPGEMTALPVAVNREGRRSPNGLVVVDATTDVAGSVTEAFDEVGASVLAPADVEAVTTPLEELLQLLTRSPSASTANPLTSRRPFR
jgi:hypothetical protein